MQVFPPPSSGAHRHEKVGNVSVPSSGASRVCTACGATVQRRECHKNRYSEYICRNCQSDGIRFTWRARCKFYRDLSLPLLILTFLVGLVLMWTLLLLVKSESHEDPDGEQNVSVAPPIETAFEASSVDSALISEVPLQNICYSQNNVAAER